MKKTKFKFLLLLVFISTLISSCTFSKILVHFKPNVDDHRKIFTCDTVRGANANDWATSSLTSTAAPSSSPLFVDVHSPANIPSIEKWAPLSQRKGAKDLNELLTKTKTTALIVIKNDSILYERYLGEGARDDAKIVFSVSKAMTATLTAIAVEEGLISLDQKVADFIPEFAKDERKEITIAHLLGMVSGLDWDDFKNLYRLGVLYYNADQKRLARRVKSKYSPETIFTYKSISTQILGLCLEKALSKNLGAYMEEKIWKPVGMQYNAFVTLDSKKKRNSRTFGGMALAPHDMARFGKLMLNDGVWEGKQIVPAWFVKDLKKRDLNKWFGYRYCYWRNGYERENFKETQHYWGAGFSGQYLYISPEDNTIIIRTGTAEKVRWSVLIGRLSRIVAEGKTDLTDKSLDFGDQFEGLYRNEKGQEMRLELLPEKDKFNRREWLWTRDKKEFKEGKKHKKLYQFDGISLGFKKMGVQTRMYYDLKDGKVIGFYYNSWPMADLKYFKKVE